MKIGLSGITKNATETLTEDGQLDEMINLRHDGAALKTIGTPKDTEFVDTDGNTVSEIEDIVFVHVAADGRNWLSVKDGYLRFYGREDESGSVVVEPSEILQLSGNVEEIRQLGEFVLVRNGHINFLLYQNSRYTVLDPQEDLNISPLITGAYGYAAAGAYGANGAGNGEAEFLALKCGGATLPGITELLGKIREEGKLYNPAFIRLAFKLYDGSYIMHTCPVLLRPLQIASSSSGGITYTDYSGNCLAVCTCTPHANIIDGYEKIDWSCTIFLYYYYIKIHLDSLQGITKYKGLVESLDVSVCEVQQFDYTDIMSPDIISYYPYPGATNIGLAPGPMLYADFTAFLFPSRGLKERFENASGFRKVKSYSLDDLLKGIDEQLDLSKDNILANLEVQDLVPDDEFSHNRINGNMFLYNQRLHVSDIQQELFGGYDLRNFFTTISDVRGDNGASTTLVKDGFGIVKTISDYTSSGQPGNLEQSDYPISLDTIGVCFSFKNSSESKIAKTLHVPADESKADLLQLSSFLCYPSADIDKIKVKVIFKAGGKFYIAMQEFEATNAGMMNLSFIANFDSNFIRRCTNNGGDGLTNTCTYTLSETEKNFYLRHIFLDSAGPVASDSDYVSENTFVRAANKIKVSATANPFYFPAEQTYEIGNGEIRGMAAATQALSQGQFGQYPVYVFCSDGIYALAVGDGEVAYSNISPVSREILTGSLVGIDDAVVFVSFDKVVMLNGKKVKSLSDALLGDSLSLELPQLTYFQQGEKCAEAIDDCSFEEFLNNAELWYNYFLKEIYVVRSDKKYIYVFDTQAGLWSKRTANTASYIESYPSLYAQETGGGVRELSSEKKADSSRRHHVFLRSRPLLLGSVEFKKIARMILRTAFEGSVKVRILASNDAVHYITIAEKEYMTVDETIKRDIPFRRCSASYMYYVIELCGEISERSYVNFCEIETESSLYKGRLR